MPLADGAVARSGQIAEVAVGTEVFVLPGQLYFGARAARVRTLLGSCVALTLWHPLRHIGGMCHYLLAQRQRRPGMALDARYGDEAVHLLVAAIQRLGAQSGEFEAHLYGGADTLPTHLKSRPHIGQRNIEQGHALIAQHGLRLIGVDVGEDVPRHVCLDLATGQVEMRRAARCA